MALTCFKMFIMLTVLFCCLLTCCVQVQQSDAQVQQDTNPTCLDMNPLIKTLAATYLGFELVDDWMGRYKLHTDVKNWFDAQEVCAQEGANLLVINSRNEAKAMRSLMEKTTTTATNYWVGFHDIYELGNYITIFNETLDTTGYADWGHEEPDVTPGKNCGVFGNFSQEYGLGNFACLLNMPYICEEETLIKDKRIPRTPPRQEITSLKDYLLIPLVGVYKLHQYNATWQEAVEICAQEGAHLVILNSEQEAEAVSSFLNEINYTDTWTGVHDQYQEGNYVTIFNEPLQSTGYSTWWEWVTFGGTDENCVGFVRNSGLEVFDCNSYTYFMCEIELSE